MNRQIDDMQNTDTKLTTDGVVLTKDVKPILSLLLLLFQKAA